MNFKKTLFIAIFILFIFILPCSVFVVSPIMELRGSSLDIDIGEKRNKAELEITSVDKLGASLETYINDRIPYRNYLIMADRSINGFINNLTFRKEVDSSDSQLEIDSYVENYPLITSDNGIVIFGQKNWLYFNYDSIWDVYKKKDLDNNYLNAICNEIGEIDKIVKSKGIKVVYVIAPEKQEVYEEYMPTMEISSNKNNMSETIVNTVKSKTGVDIIYPRKLLKSCKNNYRMYKKYDSHWNMISAYLVTNEIYKQLGLKLPNLGSLEVNRTEECGWFATEYSPAYRDLVLAANMNYTDYPSVFEYKVNYNGIENKLSDKKICVIGDSFSIDMQKLITKDFSNYFFVHGADELPNGVGFERILPADIIVYELVERHIKDKFLLNLQNLKKVLQLK